LKTNLLIRNIEKLVLCGDELEAPLKGKMMSDYSCIDNAYLSIKNGRILDYGHMHEVPNASEFVKIMDASGKFVLPSWIDSHTHIVYGESREKEFVMRIQGQSYEEIAEQGGGILNSARRLATIEEEELFQRSLPRLYEVISYGTGGLEIKSGYGLSYEAERKMLRVIRRIKEVSPIPIKSTFLGAHAIPLDYKNRRKDYIRLLTERMLPEIADEGLADYVDVFCDRGFFTVDETELILDKASKYGLRGKIHANELGITGGVQVGVKMNALSVDHLECIGHEEIECLKQSDTLPTLLPGTAFFLGIDYAPARKMIDSNLPVVLATDYNPGSTPSGRMPFILTLACLKMGMLPEETIAAATINGACALELEHELGSISRGKKANLIITRPMSSLAFLPYAYGSNVIDTVLVNGETLSQ
jgi:imidazolonepropionase